MVGIRGVSQHTWEHPFSKTKASLPPYASSLTSKMLFLYSFTKEFICCSLLPPRKTELGFFLFYSSLLLQFIYFLFNLNHVFTSSSSLGKSRNQDTFSEPSAECSLRNKNFKSSGFGRPAFWLCQVRHWEPSQLQPSGSHSVMILIKYLLGAMEPQCRQRDSLWGRGHPKSRLSCPFQRRKW